MTKIELIRTWLMHRGRRVPGIAISIILLVYLALAFGSALTARPHQDEGWIANPALNLSTKGFMGTTVLDPVSGFGMDTRGNNMPLPGINQHTYYLTPLQLVALAGWFKLFGFGLLQMRAFSIMWGVVALAAWFLIIKALTANRVLALLTVLFVAFDLHFIMRSAHGRMDMMSAALGFAAFASYLTLRKRNLQAAVLLSHSLVVASGLTHPNGGVIAFVGLLFLTVSFDRRRLSLKHLALAAIPYVIGLVGWGLYIAQDPAAFQSQFGVNAVSDGRLSAFLRPWQAVISEITIRYFSNFGIARSYSSQSSFIIVLAFILIAYLTAFLSAVFSSRIRQHSGYRALLSLTIIVFLILTFFEGRKDLWYLIYITPLLDAVCAVWSYETWKNRTIPRWAVGLIASTFLGLQVMAIAYRIQQNPYQHRFMPVVEYIRSHEGGNSLVFGNPEFGFELGFDNLVDDIWLGYFSGRRPAYIIMEERYQNLVKGMRKKSSGYDQYVSQLLTQEYQLVAEPTSYCKIYRRR